MAARSKGQVGISYHVPQGLLLAAAPLKLVAVKASHLRRGSDGFEFRCDNSENLRITFVTPWQERSGLPLPVIWCKMSCCGLSSITSGIVADITSGMANS